MWPYHPELLARPVPRYTSYPTAAEFHAGVGAADMGSALAMVGSDEPLSLYIHIPYCHAICWYCGCNTGAANRRHRLEYYLDALAAEIDLVAGRLRGHGRIQRIAFGGGSPNAVEAVEFARLVDRLVTQFDAVDPDLSVELDPRNLTPEWVAAIAATGVRRASLGVQTLAPRVQAAIGRVQPADMIRHAADELRAAGVQSINFDLMYGLPTQSIADLETTIEETLAIRPDRIALFGYAHMPNLIPRQRRIDAAGLPDIRERFAQAALGHARLTAAGYDSIGFDHFALPGDALAIAARQRKLRRNFQGFTEDRSDVLIGLGASAISAFPDRLIQNEKNSGRYRMMVSAGRLPAERGILRGDDDRIRGAVIESLLCRGEADFYGLSVCDTLHRLGPFQEAGLVGIAGSHVKLRPEALPYARAIAAVFDSYLAPQSGQFSRAV
jgi:oxygen-independent coproporphyrinogen-3 oxidase